MIELSEETKIELIKTAIKTQAGWEALAKSIHTPEAKNQCIELLKKIAGDRVMNGSAVIDVIKKQNPDLDNSDMNAEDFNFKLSDKLIETLENYMEKV